MKTCSLLWAHTRLGLNGNIYPCCRYAEFADRDDTDNPPKIKGGLDAGIHSEYFENIRNHMLNNDELPRECARCTFEENLGIESMRLLANKRYPDAYKSKPKIRFIETSFSSHCNLACRMCNETYSSKWKLINNPGIKPETIGEPSDLDYYRNADLSELDYVKILGGEPFLSKKHYEFLDIIFSQSNNPENIELRYHTNATVFPNKDIINFWKKAKVVVLFLSIDSYGEENNWLRPGASWKTVEETVQKLVELKKEIPHLVIGNKSVVSSLSIHSLDKLIMWIAQTIGFNDDKNYFDLIRTPEHLSISNLDSEGKKMVLESAETLEKKILSMMPPQKHDIVKGFMQGVREKVNDTPENTYSYEQIGEIETKLDKYFKQEIKEVFPHIYGDK